jgi:homoserine kinase
MHPDKIHVFAPATVANVACGFDVMGFAIDAPGDEVLITLKNTPGIVIKKITGDQGKLPLDPCKNTVSVGISAFLNHIGSKQGMEIELRKNLPLGSGLGSSAASSVAGVFAINALLGNPLKPQELLPFTMEAERIACGSAHADNVAPALLGGFVLVRSYDPLDVIKIPSPPDLFCTVIHPQVEVRTEDARKILKKGISLSDAIIQWGNVGGLIAGLMSSDYGLIGRSLQDVIIEPIRALLIPGFKEVKQAALDAGALGCSISGSGPSIFALSTSLHQAEKIAKAMQSIFQSLQIESEHYISTINMEGPKIIASS